MTPPSAATSTSAIQTHQDIFVKPTFGLQISIVFSQIRGVFMRSLKTRDRRQRRRRVKDENNAIELATLIQVDVVGAEESEDGGGGMIQIDGEESGSWLWLSCGARSAVVSEGPNESTVIFEDQN